METNLQKALATVAPSISIQTIWTEDESPDNSIFSKGCGLYGEDPDDWACWESAIEATIIHNGEMVTGSAYMGGTWEKYGNNPTKTNPDISGYEPQMVEEALEELKALFGVPPKEIETALSFLNSYSESEIAA